MFELDKAKRGAVLSRPERPYQPISGVSGISALFWGEHCIECAAPSCFATCDLYERRLDGRCRRFTDGQVKNRFFASLRGYGVEIAFKKWGKLESRGNTSLMPLRRLLWGERVLRYASPVLNRAGSIVGSVSRDDRWRDVTLRVADRAVRRLHHRVSTGAGQSRRPDAFVLEVYNPQREAVRLQISMAIPRQALGRDPGPRVMLPSLRKPVELPPGYSRHVVLPDEFRAVTESGLPFNMALIPEGDTSPRLVFLTADFVAFEPQPAAPVRADNAIPAKCVVWDLDNTLWDGTLLESEAVQLRPHVADLLRQLDERGILASVASKNDPGLARQKMTELGIADYMLFPQVGWRPKSEGIKKIAEKLNIGLDSFIFIDDNPFELAEVANALPMVTCLGVDAIAGLANHARLKGSSSNESRRRRLMYREAMLREDSELTFGDDFFGFLRSCEMQLKISRYRPEHLERLCELVQRTNQLNFSGHKYTRDEIEPLLADRSHEIWLLDCSDRFGSYGIVGCAVVARDTTALRIKEFMLSCRVQGKFVEQAFFAAMLRGEEQRICVNFRATGRNAPALQVLESIGFQQDPQWGMSIDLNERVLSCDFIQIDREPLPELAVAG